MCSLLAVLRGTERLQWTRRPCVPILCIRLGLNIQLLYDEILSSQRLFQIFGGDLESRKNLFTRDGED